MSTHPKAGLVGQIAKLLQDHLDAAAHLSFTLDLLTKTAAVKKQNGHKSVIADALAIEAARVDGKKRLGRPLGSKSKRRVHPVPIQSPREQTALTLAAFSQGTPRTTDEAAVPVGWRARIGSLVRHGYLSKKGDGYLRTVKEFKE